jgi:hypothetical protein
MSENVCSSQNVFNDAFKNAVHNYEKNDCNTTECVVTTVIFTIVMLVFFVWAIMLALRIKNQEQRVLHLLFAITMGPLYVLAYYSSGLE